MRHATNIIQRAVDLHAGRVAIIAAGERHTYAALLESAARVAGLLLDGRPDLAEARVAFLVPPSFTYVAVLWGIWRAGGIAVPLCTQHPAQELSHVIEDSGADIVVAHPEYEALVRPVAEARGRRFVLTTEITSRAPEQLPAVVGARGALIIYTSGTTGKPKGALSTHASLTAQIESLITAWEWSAVDRIALFLPLHHIHGILNVLSCALWSGASCEMLRGFDPAAVWNRIADDQLTVFMAVPTIYTRLIAYWEAAPDEEKQQLSDGCRRLRLMVSGSAALPVSVFEKWRSISGHALLERYGMTEIGMALSNPLRGERRPGHVGAPLPGVAARLVDEAGHPVPDGTPGEIQIYGPTVFREYWGKPEATAATFTSDGWFRTGDVAVRQNNVYRILGRSSVDIIKTGGYKVSALEIEEELRNHPAIAQCAVVGIPDPEWGERVAAAAVLHPGVTLDLKTIRTWAKKFLAAYKIPSLLVIVPDLPRNAMGKVVKPEVAKFFQKS
ncbi:MAG: acyl-CoA synthetase [bacterium]|nr:acyl-CoA synthetase [bacterium]